MSEMTGPIFRQEPDGIYSCTECGFATVPCEHMTGKPMSEKTTEIISQIGRIAAQTIRIVSKWSSLTYLRWRNYKRESQ